MKAEQEREERKRARKILDCCELSLLQASNLHFNFRSEKLAAKLCVEKILWCLLEVMDS